MNPKISFWLLLSFFVIFRSFFFEQLATKSLYDFDEARYAEIAKNILKSKQVFVPLAGGPDDPQSINVTLPNQTTLHPYLWKPPLHPVFIAINYKIFGQNEFSVRLPSLFFGLLSLFLTSQISLLLFPKFPQISFLAPLLLALSNDFSFLSSQGIAETQLLFFNLLTLFLLIKKNIKINRLLSSISLSLAFLTKSFATFWVFPLILIIMIHQKNKLKDIFSYFFVFLALVLPWHLVMYQKFGQEFIQIYILNNTLGRSSGQQQNIAPIYWYIKYALWQWKYYLLFVPIILIKLKKNHLSSRHTFLILWSTLIFIPFSLFKSKVWWYIFPFWVPTLILVSSLIIKHKHYIKFVFIILLIINFHSFSQTKTRTDHNLGIKKIAQSLTHPITNLSVYKIPYESPLFYLNTQTIDRTITDQTQYIITNQDYLSEINQNEWQIIDQQEKTYLLQKLLKSNQ